jgi:hypothetical protein
MAVAARQMAEKDARLNTLRVKSIAELITVVAVVGN